jgi:hypothetical protein
MPIIVVKYWRKKERYSMQKITKIVSIAFTILMIAGIFCINAFAVESKSNFTIGGIYLELKGTLSLSSNTASANTISTYKSGSGTAHINLYTVLSVAYTTGTPDSITVSKTNKPIGLSNTVVNVGTSIDLDLTRTYDYIVCDHNVVNYNNSSNTGTVNTSIYNGAKDGGIRITYLPGVDF